MNVERYTLSNLSWPRYHQTPAVLQWFSQSLPNRLREDKHPGSRIASGFQFLQRAIGLGEGERLGVGFYGNCSCLAQEIEPVLLRVGRNAPNDPLPENFAIVIEWGNLRHVNTGKSERAAALQ
jgi:hypothetical protein